MKNVHNYIAFLSGYLSRNKARMTRYVVHEVELRLWQAMDQVRTLERIEQYVDKAERDYLKFNSFAKESVRDVYR